MVYYNSENIIVFPSSNSTKKGKLTLEENMTRIVTRVTSKNYILNPEKHFVITVNANNSVTISSGEANIQGYDIVTNSEITLPVPKELSNGWIVMKLAKDGSDHVIGEVRDGATELFQGVYITYITTEESIDNSTLVLGSYIWNGSSMNVIPNSKTAYRYNASDVQTRIDLNLYDLDPTNEDGSTIASVQDYINRVPDWYISKFGDFLIGSIFFDVGGYSYDKDTNEGIFVNRKNCGSLLLGNNSNRGLSFNSVVPNDNSIYLSAIASLDSFSGVSMGSRSSNIFNSVSIGFPTGASSLFAIKYESIGSTVNSSYINFDTGTVNIFGNNSLNLQSYSANNNDNIVLNIFNNKLKFKSRVSQELEHVFGYDSSGINPYYSLGSLQFISNVNGTVSIINTADNTISLAPSITVNNIMCNTKLFIGTETNNISISRNDISQIANNSLINRINSDGIYTSKVVRSVNNINNSTRYSELDKDTINLYTTNTGTISINFNSSNSENNVSLTKKANEKIVRLNSNFETTGTIKGSRVYNAVFNDIAEWYEKDDLDEVFEPGDVIELNPETGKYRKTKSVASSYVVGVISDSYGYITGGEQLDNMEDNHKKYIPIGISGRVYVKVLKDVEIYPGELLTSYYNGYATSIDEYMFSGTVIGKALSKNIDGKVLMQIMLG